MSRGYSRGRGGSGFGQGNYAGNRGDYDGGRQYHSKSWRGQNSNDWSSNRDHTQQSSGWDGDGQHSHQHAASNDGAGWDEEAYSQNHESSASSELRLQVPSRKVGRIIGKGGSKIRELEEDSRCRIQIRDSDYGEEKDVIITGSYEDQQRARSLIENLLVDRQFPRRNDDRGGWRQSDAGPPTMIEVPTSKLGKVIGKGGSKIRELQQVSGAQIKILNDETSMFTTNVELRGNEESCNLAKKLIEELTADTSVVECTDSRYRKNYDNY